MVSAPPLATRTGQRHLPQVACQQVALVQHVRAAWV